MLGRSKPVEPLEGSGELAMVLVCQQIGGLIYVAAIAEQLERTLHAQPIEPETGRFLHGVQEEALQRAHANLAMLRQGRDGILGIMRKARPVVDTGKAAVDS